MHADFLKKETLSLKRCFRVNFAKVLRTPFFIEDLMGLIQGGMTSPTLF